MKRLALMLCLALALPGAAVAAHTYDTQGTSASYGTADPHTISYTCGAGTTLLVLMVEHNAQSRTGGTPTYNGVNMTQVGTEIRNAQEVGVEMWYMLNPPTGSAYDIVVQNDLPIDMRITAASFKAGSGYASALFDYATDNVDKQNTSLTVSSVPAGSVCLDVLGHGYTNPPTARSHTLIYTHDPGALSFETQYGLIDSTGDVTMTHTLGGSDDVANIMACFEEVASGATVNLSGQGTAASPGTLAVTAATDGTATLSGGASAATAGSMSIAGGTGATAALSGSGATATAGGLTVAGGASAAVTLSGKSMAASAGNPGAHDTPMFASLDPHGRATITTVQVPSTGIVWSKRVPGGSWVQIASTGAGVQSIVDKRPTKHYQWVAYSGSGAMDLTFTGTEFAIFTAPRADQSGYIDTTVGTSSTSNSLTVGQKTFTVAAGLPLTMGQSLKICRTGYTSAYFFRGTVNSYSGTTLVVDVTSVFSTGTYSAWTIQTRENFNIPASAVDRIDWENTVGKLVYGRSGLTNEAHTMNICPVDNSGGLEWDGESWNPVPFTSVYKGYWYSDFSSSWGEEIEYKAVIDGGTTETVTVTPVVNRGLAIQSIVDRLIAGNSFTNYPANMQQVTPWSNYNEMIGVVAYAYYMTQDARLVGIAEDIYDAYIANSNGTTGIINDQPDYPNGHLLVDGRTAYNYYFAYQVFNDSRYLDVADKIAGTLRNSWNKNGSNVWYPVSNASSGLPGVPNHRTAASYSLALLYNEPNSDWYQDATVSTILIANADYAVNDGVNGSQINVSTGATRYAPGTDATEEHLYGQYEWEHLQYISDSFTWEATLIGKMRDWLVDSFPWTEPYFFRSEFYWIQSNAFALSRAAAKYVKDGTIPQDYINTLYSAAFDTIPLTSADSGYVPDGTAQSSAPINDIETEWPDGVIFSGYAIPALLNNDVPKNLWAWEGLFSNPVVTFFDLPATSNSLTVNVTAFNATDDVLVTGYKITESATPPGAGDAGWTSTAPATVTASGEGSITFYPWVKDGNSNVSAVYPYPETVAISLGVTLVGQGATASRGTLAVSGNVGIPLAGEGATAARGTLTVSGGASISLAGEGSTASRGTLTPGIQADGAATLTGEAATASRGTLAVSGDAGISLSGEAATASRGTITVSGDAGISLAGEGATASRGTLIANVTADGTAVLAGEAATASRGTLAVSGNAGISLAGESATTSRGDLSVISGTVAPLSGSGSAAGSGTLAVSGNAAIPLSGQAMVASAGSLGVSGGGGAFKPAWVRPQEVVQ